MIVLKKVAFFILVFAGLLWLVTDRHTYNPEFTWRSNLWADPAGYYVYLPALFIYDFDAAKMPAKIDSLCGDGFDIDKINNKLFIKYTCGAAILQSPFFLTAHLIEQGQPSNYKGFSGLYQKVPDMAAAFYGSIALVFLFFFLRFYFDKWLSAFITAAMFLGTNIYFFTIYGNGGSHIYSFALFAVFLYLTKTITENNAPKIIHLICWAFTIAIILLIRPLNLLFLIPAVFIDCSSFTEAWERVKFFAKPKTIAVVLIAGFLTFLPQFIYWKFLSGNWIYYSYQNESFSYWKSPQLARLLFSPNNGLLPYNPIYFFIVFALAAMLFSKAKNGLLILFALLMLIYLSASWHAVAFGCGYGSRNFSEYAALFALPLAWLFQQAKNNAVFKYLTGILVVFCVLINQKAIYSHDRCFWGGDWDYKEYVHQLTRGGYSNTFTLKDGGVFSPEKEYSESFYIRQEKYTLSSFRNVKITANIKLLNTSADAMLVIDIKAKDGSRIEWKAINLRDYSTMLNAFEKVTLLSPLPREFNTEADYQLYIWNSKKDSFVVKDIEITLR
jgi:hypothetical protein